MEFSNILSLLFMIVSASAIIFWGLMAWRSVYARLFWVRATATVDEYDCVTVKDDGTLLYYPKVAYSFYVDGEINSGTRVMFKDHSGYAYREIEEKGLHNLKIGDELKIYYDAKKPNISVMFAETEKGIALPVIVCFLLYFGACYFFFEGFNA